MEFGLNQTNLPMKVNFSSPNLADKEQRLGLMVNAMSVNFSKTSGMALEHCMQQMVLSMKGNSMQESYYMANAPIMDMKKVLLMKALLMKVLSMKLVNLTEKVLKLYQARVSTWEN